MFAFWVTFSWYDAVQSVLELTGNSLIKYMEKKKYLLVWDKPHKTAGVIMKKLRYHSLWGLISVVTVAIGLETTNKVINFSNKLKKKFKIRKRISTQRVCRILMYAKDLYLAVLKIAFINVKSRWPSFKCLNSSNNMQSFADDSTIFNQ